MTKGAQTKAKELKEETLDCQHTESEIKNGERKPKTENHFD